jgi:hypothetical protein
LNNSYYETLDENFTQALKLYEEDYTHEELIELLKSGNIVQKQIAALRLEEINSTQDADVLVANLTGQDGKIREAVSLRLNEFMSNPKTLQHFKVSNNYDIFLDAIIDIKKFSQMFEANPYIFSRIFVVIGFDSFIVTLLVFA